MSGGGLSLKAGHVEQMGQGPKPMSAGQNGQVTGQGRRIVREVCRVF